MSDYHPLLASLTKAEWKAIISISKKHGFRGLLCVAFELCEFNRDDENSSPAQRKRAERVGRELGALIERMDGFEELEKGGAL